MQFAVYNSYALQFTNTGSGPAHFERYDFDFPNNHGESVPVEFRTTGGLRLSGTAVSLPDGRYRFTVAGGVVAPGESCALISQVLSSVSINRGSAFGPAVVTESDTLGGADRALSSPSVMQPGGTLDLGSAQPADFSVSEVYFSVMLTPAPRRVIDSALLSGYADAPPGGVPSKSAAGGLTWALPSVSSTPDMLDTRQDFGTLPVGGAAGLSLPVAGNRLYGVSVSIENTVGGPMPAGARVRVELCGQADAAAPDAPGSWTAVQYHGEFSAALDRDDSQGWRYRDMNNTGHLRLRVTNVGTDPVPNLVVTVVAEPF